MTWTVTLKTGRTLTVKAPDRDVAIFRAQRLGFPAVTARPA